MTLVSAILLIDAEWRCTDAQMALHRRVEAGAQGPGYNPVNSANSVLCYRLPAMEPAFMDCACRSRPKCGLNQGSKSLRGAASREISLEFRSCASAKATTPGPGLQGRACRDPTCGIKIIIIHGHVRS